jgi:hypothetical protein
MLQVKTKMTAATVSDEAYKAFEVTIEQYHHELRKTVRLGPSPTALYYVGMKDKLDLTRMPIMKKTRTRLQQTLSGEPSIESTSVPASQPLEDENQGLEQEKGDLLVNHTASSIKSRKGRV